MPQLAQRQVPSNGEQPRCEPGSSAEAAPRLVDPQERFAHQILRRRPVSHQVVEKGEEPRLVPVEEPRQGRRVSLGYPAHRLLILAHRCQRGFGHP